MFDSAQYYDRTTREDKQLCGLLIGTLPLEAYLDMGMLSPFGSIARFKDSKIFDVAYRQLVMKEESDKSWFSTILKLFRTYDLGRPLRYLNENHTKETWKRIYKTAANKYWHKQLYNEATGKQSLRFLNLE